MERWLSAVGVGVFGVLLGFGTAPARAECPAGKVAVGEHCCWPGQDWGANSQRCIGVPQCPSGLSKSADGQSCQQGCAAGKISVGGHCCWPGQDWGASSQRCIGTPRCPVGFVPAEGGRACTAIAASGTQPPRTRPPQPPGTQPPQPPGTQPPQPPGTQPPQPPGMDPRRTAPRPPVRVTGRPRPTASGTAAPPAPRQPVHQRWWFATGLGVSGGFLLISAITLGLTKQRADRWQETGDIRERSAGRSLAAATDAFFVLGLAGVGATLLAYFLVSRKEKKARRERAFVPRFAAGCGPTGCRVALEGRF